MLLREIHIKGFKSFADAVHMRLEEGVTSIVGPNGCGKSNLLDAVRWVLGEQRARLLRVEHMQQLIFNGSIVRKSMYRAEVSIILEKVKNLLPTSRHDVQITRVIYKTGESEYLINGTPARLRDLQHLVLDSGISSEAYSIIELKMVEDLLSDKEGSRAKLFEQAAGIAKFKKQKIEALKKLAATEAALERVQDILHELQKNLHTLEKQSQKARLYKQKNQIYEALRAYYTSLRERLLSEKYQEALRTQTQEEQRFSNLNSERHKHEAQIIKDKSAVDILEKSLQQAQKSLQQCTQTLQQALQGIDFKKQKHALLTHRITEQEEKIKRHEQETLEAKSRAAQGTKNLNILMPMLARLKIAKEQSTAHQKHLFEELQGIRNTHHELLQRKLTMEKEYRAQHKQLLLQQMKVQSIEKEQGNIGKMQTEQAEAANHLKEELTRLYDLQKQAKLAHEKLQPLIEQATLEEQKQAQMRQSQQQRLAHYEQALQHYQDTIAMLTHMQNSMEGFPEAIRALRTHEDFKDKLSLFSEILEILPPYRSLIIHYLRNYSQYLICSKRKTAEAAALYLYEQCKGEASFFILDELASPTPAFSKNRLHFVRTAPRYERLMYFLFQHVSLVKDTTSAHSASDTILIDYKAHSICSQGILKGGRSAEQPPLWGLEAEKVATERRIRKVTKHIDELRTALRHSTETHAQLPALKQKQQTLQQQIQAHAQSIALVEQRLQQHNTYVEDAQVRIRTLRATHKELQHAFLTDQAHLQKTKQSLVQIEKEQVEVAAQLQQQEEHYEIAQQESQQAQLTYIEKENEKKRYEASISLHHSYDSQTQDRLTEEKEALVTLRRELNQLQQEMTQEKQGLSVYYTKEEEAKKAVDGLEQAYYKAKGKIHEQEQALREHEKNATQAQLLVKEYKGVLTQIQSEQAHLHEAFHTTFNSSWKESLKRLQHLLPKDISQEAQEAHQQSEQLRAELIKMGQVNPLAAENYDQLQQRHAFISKEEQDLLSAKQSIEETMQIIHKTVHERFMKAFTTINTHFQTVFKHLFAAEDVCELRLLHKPSEELPTIEIIAQPKGKKPMRIEQLSSGEKTLTAIALLMAIYLHKPSPFCILDEVDAPLDDVNSQKFTALVRQLSEKAQFILITHNKHTMKNSDILYGFTMPEAGVTKILPVDLRKVQSNILSSKT